MPLHTPMYEIDSKVEISKEKAIEIIMAFTNDKGNYHYERVEKYLLKEGFIQDCVTYKEYEEIIQELNSHTLTELIELI